MLKILIAEDDTELRQLFSLVLHKNGYDVRVIGDADKVGLAGKAIADGYHLGRSL